MSDELKPCPFCGGSAAMHQAHDPDVYAALRNPFDWGLKTQGVRGLVMRNEDLPGGLTAEVKRRAGWTFDANVYDPLDERRLSEVLRDVLIERGHDGVIAKNTSGSTEVVAFHPEQIKSAIGNSGRFDPNSASLTDQPAPRAAEQTQQPKTASEQAKEATAGAQDAAKAFRESGQSLDEFVGRSNLAPAPRNLLIGLAEAGKDSVRIKRMLDDFARTAEAHPDVPLANVAADVVDASRAGREVTPKQSAEALKADPASDMTAQRVSRVESDTPDLPVTRDADGNTQTAREVMETARREAAEGTDDTLGALDAPLIEVAARCFLANGA